MGYEIAGGLGAKLACPDREVVVCVGDMSFLMASQEIVTAVQHRIPFYGGGIRQWRRASQIRYFQKGSGFADYAIAISPMTMVSSSLG